jgi:CRISPR-associated endonuclease/helicase Cas3
VGRLSSKIVGKSMADAGAARIVALLVDEPFIKLRFPANDERIRRRLRGEGARVVFTEPVMGPIGQAIAGVTLPAHWSRGIDAREPLRAQGDSEELLLRIGETHFRDRREGLLKGVQ